MAAAPMGIPGCPELAFSTPSAESILIVFMQVSSSFLVIFIPQFPLKDCDYSRSQAEAV
jgi:hypothetical protein